MKKITSLLLLAILAAAMASAEPYRILAIGNSFTVDAVQDDLAPLARAAGVDLLVGYPYKGGTTYQLHKKYLAADSAAYSYRKTDTDSLRVTRRPHTRLIEAIRDEDWDLVVFQTDHNFGGVEERILPYMKEIAGYVRANLRNPDKTRFALYMTWAYDSTSNYKWFPLYDRSQAKMYRAYTSLAPKLAEAIGASFIIPAGTAIQNLRTSCLGDHMNRDGYHMNLDWGRYTVACTWLEKIFGRSALGSSYRPKELSAFQANLCATAAHNAVRKPFGVTDMSGMGRDPLLEFWGDSIPRRLELGTTLGPLKFDDISYTTLRNLRNSGINHLEISLTNLVNGEHPRSERELRARFAEIRRLADSAGINIRSIHMPYAEDCDPAAVSEKVRRESVKKYKLYMDMTSVLAPEYYLFHPSWNIPAGQRALSMRQCARSIAELARVAPRYGASILVENLRGPQLRRANGMERGLGRTVGEMVELMSMMPDDVYAVVDLNHIDRPERLIRALGPRIRSLHVCDSDGERDRHWLPGRGHNDWPEIIAALYEVGYTGPWLYEIKAGQVEEYAEMTSAYEWAYRSYLEREMQKKLDQRNKR